MLVWRLCKAGHADLMGEGARLVGGRWHSPGHPLLYTADSAALAVLEVRVHLDLPPELIPDDYMLMSIELGSADIEDVVELPPDPRAFGDAWLQEQRSLALRVPSHIVPESANILGNPAHSLSGRMRIRSVRPFSFDRRLWLPLQAG